MRKQEHYTSKRALTTNATLHCMWMNQIYVNHGSHSNMNEIRKNILEPQSCDTKKEKKTPCTHGINLVTVFPTSKVSNKVLNQTHKMSAHEKHCCHCKERYCNP